MPKPPSNLYIVREREHSQAIIGWLWALQRHLCNAGIAIRWYDSDNSLQTCYLKFTCEFPPKAYFGDIVQEPVDTNDKALPFWNMLYLQSRVA